MNTSYYHLHCVELWAFINRGKHFILVSRAQRRAKISVMGSNTMKPVTVSLHDLEAGDLPFDSLLEAFGPSSLGILVVTDLPPHFPSLRSRVLASSSSLAHLPEKELSALVNPSAKYLTGWSHGVETLRPGLVDTAKGSYYINCGFYHSPPFPDSTLSGADPVTFPGFEEYTSPNIWPAECTLPSFRADAETLIRLIIDVAVLVARACDRYAEREVPKYTPGYLEKVVKTSVTTKARLLHYFPSDPSSSVEDHETTNDDSWCATHVDHGCLTGLTSAMFLDEASSPSSEISSPDPQAGLYILDRSNTTHKISIPRDALAFQTGETLQLITQGRFKAVPHFVRGTDAPNVARNTLGVFTQPNLDEVVDLETGLTFGEFARGVVGKNTTMSSAEST